MCKRILLFITLGMFIFSLLVSCESTQETIIVDTDVTDEHIIDRFYDAYKNIPEWLRNDFEKQGWSVQLFDDLSEVYGSDINGLTVYNDKIIYINATDFGTAKHVMAHEMGHYLDWALDWISFSDEFQIIFDNEYPSFAENINSQSYIENEPAEYWADCCFYYMALPEKLETYCPQTFEYIDNFIYNYSGGIENIPIEYD